MVKHIHDSRKRVWQYKEKERKKERKRKLLYMIQARFHVSTYTLKQTYKRTFYKLVFLTKVPIILNEILT